MGHADGLGDGGVTAEAYYQPDEREFVACCCMCSRLLREEEVCARNGYDFCADCEVARP